MKILVVDDQRSVATGIMRFFELEGWKSAWAANGEDALRALEAEAFDAVVSDLRMPVMGGMQLFESTRDQGLRVPFIFISGYGEIEDAVEAMKKGAADFLRKPFDPDELILRLRRAAEDRALREAVEFGRSAAGGAVIIGESKAMRGIRDTVAAVGPASATVLITGESGTGKEVVARALHASSAAPEAPFVAVNLGGVPEQLAESELFGYERGAFTGAGARKIGFLESAGEGTIFLDEIGEMGAPLQVKMLRVLQERRITRLGAVSPVPLRARIVAATNRDIEREVREGRFREDLYYRINVVRMSLPPLRERKEDIPILAGAAMARIATRMGRSTPSLAPDALRKLAAHGYPGNVRELENILERALIFSRDMVLGAGDLDIPDRTGEPVRELPAPRTLRDMEIAAVETALRRWNGNRVKAAEELGIGRRTIFDLIERYGIDGRRYKD
jgi:two-component system response regulator AtoC